MSISINKEKFDKFEEVMKSGEYNMWDKNARFETDLTEEEWVTIMTDYGTLKKSWSTDNNEQQWS